MTDSAAQPPPRPAIQAPPALPEVDSPPTEEVLDGVPSKEDVVVDALTADEIVNEQPTVDELIGPDR